MLTSPQSTNYLSPKGKIMLLLLLLRCWFRRNLILWSGSCITSWSRSLLICLSRSIPSTYYSLRFYTKKSRVTFPGDSSRFSYNLSIKKRNFSVFIYIKPNIWWTYLWFKTKNVFAFKREEPSNVWDFNVFNSKIYTRSVLYKKIRVLVPKSVRHLWIVFVFGDIVIN